MVYRLTIPGAYEHLEHLSYAVSKWMAYILVTEFICLPPCLFSIVSGSILRKSAVKLMCYVSCLCGVCIKPGAEGWQVLTSSIHIQYRCMHGYVQFVQ